MIDSNNNDDDDTNLNFNGSKPKSPGARSPFFLPSVVAIPLNASTIPMKIIAIIIMISILSNDDIYYSNTSEDWTRVSINTSPEKINLTLSTW
jgi:hypothetical protein